jgi:hypothetical protein
MVVCEDTNNGKGKAANFIILLKTHPDIATLVGPLFACGGKRAKNIFLNFNIELLNSFRQSRRGTVFKNNNIPVLSGGPYGNINVETHHMCLPY